MNGISAFCTIIYSILRLLLLILQVNNYNQMNKSFSRIFILFLVLSNSLYASKLLLDLSGKWRFKTDISNVGEREKWYRTRLNDSINLPGSMVENLKGEDITLQTKFTGSIYDSSWFFNPHLAKYRTPENLKMPFWLTQLKRTLS